MFYKKSDCFYICTKIGDSSNVSPPESMFSLGDSWWNVVNSSSILIGAYLQLPTALQLYTQIK